MCRVSLIYLLIFFTFLGCSKEEQKQPNILFCLADDVSFQHLSVYGCEWINTPGIEKLASGGLVFNNTYTPNAKCAPSRASILTGRYSWQLEEAGNHFGYFPSKYSTFVEALGEHGYFTGYTGKGWKPGDPGMKNGKIRELIGNPYQSEVLSPPTKDISENDYAANFRKFLGDKPDNTPFFFWYGSNEPHRGYTYRSGIELAGMRVEDIDRVPSYWPDVDSVRTDMLDYAYEIEYFDKHLQQMLTLLEDEGELENTIIVVTADNGMPFPRVKGQAYHHSNHLPMVIMWKNGIIKTPRKVDEYISFVDLAPTFLELAGIEIDETEMQDVYGNSFSDLLKNRPESKKNSFREYSLIGKERHDVGRPQNQGYPIRGIIKDNFLFIQNFETTRWPSGNPETGYLNCDASPTKTVALENHNRLSPFWKFSFGKRPEFELYNIEQDPDCMQNLAYQEDYINIKEDLNNLLYSKLKEQGDPRLNGEGFVFDSYPVFMEEFGNYYEKFIKGEAEVASWISPLDVDTVNAIVPSE